MKEVIIILILLLFCKAIQAQERAMHPFNIVGTIIGKEAGYVYLNYVPAGQHGVMDSCLIKNGHFTFKGAVAEPTKAFFVTNGVGENGDHVADFYIAPGTMQLSVNVHQFKNIQVAGSALDSDYRRFLTLLNPIKAASKAAEDSLRKWQEQLKNKQDTFRLVELDKKRDSIKAVQAELNKKLFRVFVLDVKRTSIRLKSIKFGQFLAVKSI